MSLGKSAIRLISLTIGFGHAGGIQIEMNDSVLFKIDSLLRESKEQKETTGIYHPVRSARKTSGSLDTVHRET